MPLQVKCPSCATVLKLPDTVPPGGAVRCPKCQTVLKVPGKPPAPKPAVPAVQPSPPPKPASPPRPPAAIKSAASSAPPDRRIANELRADEDDDLPARAKPKSKKGLLFGILGCVGLLFLVCGGGLTFGIYKLVSGAKQVSRQFEDELKKQTTGRSTEPTVTIPPGDGAGKQPPVNPPEPKPPINPPDNKPPVDPPDKNPPPAKPLDVAYIPADFNAAFVIHPARILRSKSPLLPSGQMLEAMLGEAVKETGIDPRQLDEAIVLVEPFPGGNVAFFPAGILRFSNPVDGKKILGGGLKELQEVRMGDKTYYNSKTEKMAKTPLSGFVADQRTILLAPEPTLKKMLAARNVNSPLIDRLRKLDLDHDVSGVFVLGPFRPVVAELAKNPDIPPPLAGVKTLDKDLDAATFFLDLNGSKLLEVVLDGTSPASANSLEQLVKGALDMGKQMYGGSKDQLQKEAAKELPPDLAPKLLRAVDQFANDGIKVTRRGQQVYITVDKPKGLDGQ